MKKSKPRPGQSRSAVDIDLNEKEESSGDDGDSQDDAGKGLGDDAVDLAAMLDDDDDDITGANDHTLRDMGERSSDEDEEEDEEEEEGYSESESEGEDRDDAGDEERNARMRDMLDSLDPQERSSKTKENALPGKAAIDDFLEGLDLGNDVVLGTSKSKKKISKPVTLAAPLPKRQQDRADREVASKKAKEQLDRWRDTVIRNRRAEFLSFPLQNPNEGAGTTGKDNFTPATQQKPQTDLEESIQRIMEESGLSKKAEERMDDEETNLLKAEELEAKKLPVQEVLQRRAELRRTRELLFREEIKAKRIAKIKSKSYRRVHRKEHKRLAEQDRQAREELCEDGIEEDEKERNDRKRAEARMSTKHKDSKWAKSLKATNRAVWDDDARDGVIEQARRVEELKRRIAGHDVSDEDDQDSGSDESEFEDPNDAVTLEHLENLQGSDTQKQKGLAGMKFMQTANERRRKANDEAVEGLRRELAIADGDEDEEEVKDEGLGRAVFGPRPTENPSLARKEERPEFEAPDVSDDENDSIDGSQARATTTQSGDVEKPAVKSILKKPNRTFELLAKGATEDRETQSTTTDPSGWLFDKPPRENEWLKQVPKSMSKKNRAVEDGNVLNLIHDGPPKPRSTKSSQPATVPNGVDAGNTDGWITVRHDDGSNSKDEDQANPIDESQTMMQRAFAGEDVRLAFEKEKDDLAVDEDEKEESTFLPGWGSWGGAGLTKFQKQQNTRKKHHPLYKTKIAGVKKADRKDAELENVIISEKHDRKGRKYLAPVLPHEFENQEQYERSRRAPMGPEWTTKEVHQRMTRPRVVVRKGVVGGALERPVI